MRIGIIGSGSFGMALARHFFNNNHEVKIWSYLKEEKEYINNKHSIKTLPEIIFDKKIVAYNDIEEVIRNTDIIFHVTPSQNALDTLKNYVKYLDNQSIVICSKGFDKKTALPLSVAFEQILKKNNKKNDIGVLSGPTHAEEISRDILSAMVIASKSDKLKLQVLDAINSKIIRLYKSDDLIGVEVGGTIKNIIAFCAGICAGLNLGDNTFAALITRGLVETSKFAKAYNADMRTVYGLSGLGDLIVTCSSMHSRNRRAGMLLAKGHDITKIREEIGMVIESIDNIETIRKIAKEKNIEMPIIESVYDVLFNSLAVNDAIEKLMNRKLKDEF